MTRYALIGGGMMAQEHIRNLALLSGVEIVGVADPDPGMLSTATALAGCPGFPDHRAMLAVTDADALVISAPNHTHFDILNDVMATDAAILCEKPLCTTVENCAAIEAAATGRKAPIWVAMEYRYMPPVARLRNEVAAGTAGQLKMLTVREHRFPFLEKVGDWNRFSENTGGTLVEKCCHHFDLMRLILQAEPIRVYASGGVDVNHLDERYDGRVPDILDNAYVIVDFDTGARGMLELSMFAEGAYWQEEITAVGDQGRVIARIPGPARFTNDGAERHAEVAIARREEREEVTHVIETDERILNAGDHHGSTFYQHEKFLAMVRNGGTPEVTLSDGAIAVSIGAAAEESTRTGLPVCL